MSEHLYVLDLGNKMTAAVAASKLGLSEPTTICYSLYNPEGLPAATYLPTTNSIRFNSSDSVLIKKAVELGARKKPLAPTLL